MQLTTAAASPLWQEPTRSIPPENNLDAHVKTLLEYVVWSIATPDSNGANQSLTGELKALEEASRRLQVAHTMLCLCPVFFSMYTGCG